MKPSPETVLDSLVLAEAAQEAGVPAGVLNIVPAGREVGAYLVSHPRIDKVAFTGSTAAGRSIAETCGRLLRPVSLELGGKSAAIVLEDADLSTAAEALFGATLLNNGQTCYLGARVLAPGRGSLTAGEWALLGLLDQSAAHGFALARAMAPDGDVGRIWSMRRTMVYSALDNLEQWALVQSTATVPSDCGPRRTILEATTSGIAALDDWLQEPVERVRDGRSLLMLKLFFLTHRGENVAPLLFRQREAFTAQARRLASAAEDAVGFDRALLLWRLHSTRAVIEFTDAMLTEPASSTADPPSRWASVES
jgi:DNA-binding PadR family transcriptional regulator